MGDAYMTEPAWYWGEHMYWGLGDWSWGEPGMPYVNG